jgi:hypothetical protein
MKREGVPRGSTRVGQVSKPLTRVTTPLVHISSYSIRQRHMAASGWARLAARCHLAPSHWSTSASGPHPGTSHLTGGPHLSATWQSTSGPPHASSCHMAQPHEATSTCLCHMAQLHQATSTQLCHMASSGSATSALINMPLGLRKECLTQQPIRYCQHNLINSNL